MAKALVAKLGVQTLAIAAVIALAGSALAATAVLTGDAASSSADVPIPAGDVVTTLSETATVELPPETGTVEPGDPDDADAESFGAIRSAAARAFGECMADGGNRDDCAELKPGPAWQHAEHPGRGHAHGREHRLERDGEPGAHGRERAAEAKERAAERRDAKAQAKGDNGSPEDSPTADGSDAAERGRPDHAGGPAAKESGGPPAHAGGSGRGGPGGAPDDGPGNGGPGNGGPGKGR